VSQDGDRYLLAILEHDLRLKLRDIPPTAQEDRYAPNAAEGKRVNDLKLSGRHKASRRLSFRTF
jgi:hypothetical protein